MEKIQGTRPSSTLASVIGILGPLRNQKLREILRKQDIKALAREIETRNLDVNAPLRHTYGVDHGQVDTVWRSPLELVIDRGGHDSLPKAVYLLENGALITVPAMALAIRTPRHHDQATLDTHDAKLLAVLTAAGADWNSMFEDEGSIGVFARQRFDILARSPENRQILERAGIDGPRGCSFTSPEAFIAGRAAKKMDEQTPEASTKGAHGRRF